MRKRSGFHKGALLRRIVGNTFLLDSRDPQRKRSLPTPRNSTVKSPPIAGVKNLGTLSCLRVGDYVDGGSVALISKILAIQKYGESFVVSKAGTEPQKGISTGEEHIRMI